MKHITTHYFTNKPDIALLTGLPNFTVTYYKLRNALSTACALPEGVL